MLLYFAIISKNFLITAMWMGFFEALLKTCPWLLINNVKIE